MGVDEGRVDDHMAEMLEKREGPAWSGDIKAATQRGLSMNGPLLHSHWRWPLVKAALCLKSWEELKTGPCETVNGTRISFTDFCPWPRVVLKWTRMSVNIETVKSLTDLNLSDRWGNTHFWGLMWFFSPVEVVRYVQKLFLILVWQAGHTEPVCERELKVSQQWADPDA